MLNWITRRCWPVLRSTFNGWQEHDGTMLSAATAYCAAFSLFPLCVVLIAGLGLVGQYSILVQSEERQILDRLAGNASPWLADQLGAILAEVQSRAMLGGPLGLLVLLVSAIALFMQLESIFAHVWGAPGPAAGGWLAAVRAALWDRLLAFLTLLAIGALLIAVTLTDAILAGVRPYVVELPAGDWAWRAVQTLATVACDAVLLGAIYRTLPKARVSWIAALAGGMMAAIVWAIGRSLLLYLVVGKQESAYGVLGAIMGVMLWFYYASAVVFLGAEFVRALSEEPARPAAD
jgi:membrane protein